MEFKEVIGRRRSIRYFVPYRPVEREGSVSIGLIPFTLLCESQRIHEAHQLN
jgi:hypothetical protein